MSIATLCIQIGIPLFASVQENSTPEWKRYSHLIEFNLSEASHLQRLFQHNNADYNELSCQLLKQVAIKYLNNMNHKFVEKPCSVNEAGEQKYSYTVYSEVPREDIHFELIVSNSTINDKEKLPLDVDLWKRSESSFFGVDYFKDYLRILIVFDGINRPQLINCSLTSDSLEKLYCIPRMSPSLN